MFTLQALAVAMLAACGGGGGGSAPVSPVGSVSGQYAQQCSPDNPYRQDGDAGPSPSVGTLALEKQWAREYVNEAYLWYANVPSVDAAAPAYSDASVAGHADSLGAYFSALTSTPSDRFSFTYPTKAWNQLSRGGVVFGYGAEFATVVEPGGTTRWRVAFVEPGGPAAVAGLRRGDTLEAIDGTPIGNLGTQAIASALRPGTSATHIFVFSRSGSANVGAVLTAASLALSPVPSTAVIDTPTGRVGYVLFNDHVLTAENALVNALQGLVTQGVGDLVIDLRYNAGGYLFLASQLGYMVAGPQRTTAKIFERRQYSDKRVGESNSTNSITPFFNTKCAPDTSQGFVCTSTSALPTLNLSRVWVLVGPDTCSPSESLVNALRGVDVTVNLIGSSTCGKPYASNAKDNCGISYFPIESRGVNAKATADYANGFAPTCAADDDFDHALGDPAERLLAVALRHRASGSCGSSGAAKPQHPPARARLLPRLERTQGIDQPLSGRGP